jgi:hypothetical protein
MILGRRKEGSTVVATQMRERGNVDAGGGARGMLGGGGAT